MIYFNSDYCEGAHEKIMERLIATNREQTVIAKKQQKKSNNYAGIQSWMYIFWWEEPRRI